MSLIDISSRIFYDDIKAKEEFTNLINSTISHEMRNPLNAIINQNLVQKQNFKKMDQIILEITHIVPPQIVERMKTIMRDMR